MSDDVMLSCDGASNCFRGDDDGDMYLQAPLVMPVSSLEVMLAVRPRAEFTVSPRV